MIVNSNAFGSVGIPYTDASLVLDLVPGYNDVPNEVWARVRKNALRKINAGDIKEEFIKTDRKNLKNVDDRDIYPPSLVLDADDAKETTKCMVPAALSDIDRKGQKVSNLIKGTYHVPTLNKWYGEEVRADVRVEIQKQIAGIEDGSIKG